MTEALDHFRFEGQEGGNFALPVAKGGVNAECHEGKTEEPEGTGYVEVAEGLVELDQATLVAGLGDLPCEDTEDAGQHGETTDEDTRGLNTQQRRAGSWILHFSYKRNALIQPRPK